MGDWNSVAAGALMVGLPGLDLDGEARQTLTELDPAGVILFSRNLDSPEQTADLIRQVRACLSRPALIALDQEGGRVSRLAPWIGETPTAATLAAAGEAAIASFAVATAGALRGLGFNVDFAPVVDLCDPTAGNGIDDRSFGDDPRQVARLAGRFLDELQGAGVAGCLKHFPGLGRTSVDSHRELPTVSRTLDELSAHELRPFSELAPRAASIMIGHGHYPAWDPEAPLPASGSTAIVRGILRESLGYRGLAVSDDLEMGAVGNLDRGGAFAVRSIAAGCDLLLYCADPARAQTARSALGAAAGADPEFAERLGNASSTVADVAARWPAPEPDLALFEQARRALITGQRASGDPPRSGS